MIAVDNICTLPTAHFVTPLPMPCSFAKSLNNTCPRKKKLNANIIDTCSQTVAGVIQIRLIFPILWHNVLGILLKKQYYKEGFHHK